MSFNFITVTDFILGDSKITVDSECGHKIKRLEGTTLIISARNNFNVKNNVIDNNDF